jgi:hypothetical protein
MTLELGLRYSLWQPWGAENNEIASFNSAYYDPASAVTINPAAGFVVPNSGDPFNGIVIPGDGPSEETLRSSRSCAADAVVSRRAERLRRHSRRRLSATSRAGVRDQRQDDLPHRHREVPEPRADQHDCRLRVQPAAVRRCGRSINGNVDTPAGAERRDFPLLMAMQTPDLSNPTSWAWNATVDRQLFWQLRTQLSYVGRSASHLERARNINQLQAGTIQANTGINANALRPYKGFGNITLYETTGESKYNAFQLNVDRRSTRGVSFNVAYTFSRTEDNGSDIRDPRTELL